MVGVFVLNVFVGILHGIGNQENVTGIGKNYKNMHKETVKEFDTEFPPKHYQSDGPGEVKFFISTHFVDRRILNEKLCDKCKLEIL